jgi:Protein of unknown function (DUF4197)
MKQDLPPGMIARHDLRRRLLVAGAGVLVLPHWAYADLLSSLSSSDAAAGIRTALQRGAEAAVGLLGRTDGFWGNERVRIPLPDWLTQAEPLFGMMGRKQELDDLHLSVNRAAEQAVPQARQLLVGAVKSMSVQDAKGILTGGDNSATEYFEKKTRTPLAGRFLPIVTQVTRKSGLAQQYDGIAQKAQSLGLVKEDATIEHHVTNKALDGLFLMISDEEKKIRADPAATGSAILKKVFGSLP